MANRVEISEQNFMALFAVPSSEQFVAAGASGLVDVDAVALARGPEAQGFDQAALGIVLACASNNRFKSAIGIARGTGPFRRGFALSLAAITLVGAPFAH